MAEPILLDRFRDHSYSQNQLINDKLDFIVGEIRDMKQDIRSLNEKIDKNREELKGEIDKVDKKIDATREELKGEIDKLDEKIDSVEKKLDEKIDKNREELKKEIDKNHSEVKQIVSNAKWQVFGVVVAQICSIGAIVWAIVSALR